MWDSTVFHSFENSLTSLEMSHANFERIPAAVCRLKYLKSFRSDSSPNLGRYNGSIFDVCTHTMTTVTSLTLRFDQLTTIPKLVHIFSSPEPKAQGELIVYRSSCRLSVCLCVWLYVCGHFQTRISPQPVGQS